MTLFKKGLLVDHGIGYLFGTSNTLSTVDAIVM